MKAALALGVLVCACGGPAPLPRPVLPLTPTPDAPFRARPPAITESDPVLPSVHAGALENGFTLLVVERRDLPLVSLAFVNRAAHDDDTRPSQGLAPFTARLLDEGTSFGDGQILRHLRVGGAYPWFDVTAEATLVGINVPATSLTQSIELLAEVVRRPTFDASAFALARADVETSIFHQSLNGAYQLRDLALTGLAGPEHPPIAGARGVGANVARYSPEQVRRFYDQHYGPQESALIVVGDTTFDVANELVHRQFGDWLPRPASAAFAAPGLEYSNTPVRVWGLEGYPDEATFALALPCPSTSDLHGVDADLLGMLLASEAFSRVVRSPREDSGIASGLSAGCEQHPGFGVFWIEVSVGVDQASQALATVLSDIEQLRRAPVASDELALAKHRYSARLATVLATNRATTDVLSALYAHGLPADALVKLSERVRSVTAEDLRATAMRYFNGRQGIAVFGARAALEPALSRFGRVQWTYVVDSRTTAQ